MQVPPTLTPVLWCAIAVLCSACIALGAGFSLLLGTVRQQKIGLRFIWASLGLLAAAIVAIVLVFTHA